MEKEIDVVDLQELSPDKVYLITLPGNTEADDLNSFAYSVSKIGLKALVVRDSVKFEYFQDMFGRLPDESKTKLLKLLEVKPPATDWVESVEVESVNPLAHEQTK